jgi:CheY-like chemotaxis protein
MADDVKLSQSKTPILIVDDDTFLLDMYALKFSKGAYDVHTADNAETALKQIRDGFTPEVLLMDVIMPGLTGLEALETIRKENLIPNATIIMLTNQSMGDDLERAKRCNVDGYIVKAMAIPSEVLTEVEKIRGAHLARKK